mgnify:CR=1 FL=1|tara:strand:- start:108 stop:377 length:270 start_codon:yes stop_codon:yes gene_type:complete
MQEKTVKKIYEDANNKLPEEIKFNVSLEKAEKVVKAPKKPTNKRGLYICSNLGSRLLMSKPKIKQPMKFTPNIPIGILTIANLFNASAR